MHMDQSSMEPAILEDCQYSQTKYIRQNKSNTVLGSESKREGLIQLVYKALVNPHFEYYVNSVSSS